MNKVKEEAIYLEGREEYILATFLKLWAVACNFLSDKKDVVKANYDLRKFYNRYGEESLDMMFSVYTSSCVERAYSKNFEQSVKGRATKYFNDEIVLPIKNGVVSLGK